VEITEILETAENLIKAASHTLQATRNLENWFLILSCSL
jgi:hypothetical protein